MIFEEKNDMQLVCFSHLPWNFVYQRPQHLLSRFTKKYEVYYIEEFVYNEEEDGYSAIITDENVLVIVPNLNNSYQGAQHENKRKEIVLKNIFREHVIHS